MVSLNDLNSEQRKAVTHKRGPLLIVAGAGTGKTTVITRRIAWLIENTVKKSDEVLALTFTDKAAGEMEERIDKLLPYGYTDLWVSTFHAFGERLLKAHGLDIGIPYDFKLLTDTEQWLLINKNLDKFKLNYYRPLGNPTKFIHALLTHFSRAKDEEISPEDYLKYAKSRLKKTRLLPDDKRDEALRLQEVAAAYQIYQQLLLDETALDFGDLINFSLKLLRSRPDILQKYQTQFKHILVDEFQDTNWAQYELVKLLAASHQNLTVVGDDDQSIYRFRGASMSNILQFKTDYPTAKSVVLTTNYRSSQNILDLSYNFIKLNNPNRLEYQLQKTDASLQKKLYANTNELASIEHLSGQTAEDEEQLVINKLRSLKKIDPECGWGDMAILARTNDVANNFDAVLERAGIPHISYTSKGLYKKKSIIDTISYLKLLDNYHESQAVWRVLNFAHLNLSSTTLVTLSHMAAKTSSSIYQMVLKCETLDIANNDLQKLQQLQAWVNEHSLLAREKMPSEILVRALTDIGYTAYIDSLDENLAKVEFDYLNQLYQRIKRWEHTQNDPRLRDFLESYKFELEAGEEGDLKIDPDLGPDTVKIMTVHAAKGLEFKYVFVVNLVTQRFPTNRRSQPIEMPAKLIKEKLPTADAHIEEERRLFYVALTRAKRGLYLTSAVDYGGARHKKPSPFLVELGINLSAPQTVKQDKLWTSNVFSERVADNELIKHVPEHFSFTALKAYETCPFQYRYSHVLKVPVWGRHTFSFGQSMHLALELFFQQLADTKRPKSKTKKPNLDDLLNFYENNWLEEWYTSRAHRDQYFAKGREALIKFYNKHHKKWPAVQAVERGFTLKIGPYSVKGKVDRIDKVNNKLVITDYKTGKPKTLKEAEKDQLLIYQLAAKQVWHEEVSELVFYYLDDNSSLSFLGTEDELVEMQSKISNLIDKIHTGDFKHKASPATCVQCDFKTICPYSKA